MGKNRGLNSLEATPDDVVTLVIHRSQKTAAPAQVQFELQAIKTWRLQASTHWSGSNVEFEENTQANNLYGCLGIGLRYSEILEFKSKDGGFPNYDHIRFLFYEKIRPRTLK